MKLAGGGKGGLLVVAAVAVGGFMLYKKMGHGGGGGGIVPAGPMGNVGSDNGQGTVMGPPDKTDVAGPSAMSDLWMQGGTSDFEAQGLTQRFSQAYAAKIGPRRAYPSFYWDFRDPGVSYNDNILFNKAPWAAPYPGYNSFWNPQDTTTLKFSGSLNCECCNPRTVPKSI